MRFSVVLTVFTLTQGNRSSPSGIKEAKTMREEGPPGKMKSMVAENFLSCPCRLHMTVSSDTDNNRITESNSQCLAAGGTDRAFQVLGIHMIILGYFTYFTE